MQGVMLGHPGDFQYSFDAYLKPGINELFHVVIQKVGSKFILDAKSTYNQERYEFYPLTGVILKKDSYRSYTLTAEDDPYAFGIAINSNALDRIRFLLDEAAKKLSGTQLTNDLGLIRYTTGIAEFFPTLQIKSAYNRISSATFSIGVKAQSYPYIPSGVNIGENSSGIAIAKTGPDPYYSTQKLYFLDKTTGTIAVYESGFKQYTVSDSQYKTVLREMQSLVNDLYARIQNTSQDTPQNEAILDEILRKLQVRLDLP
jgi:hypothetical protein